ncbi:hypothetical protein BDV06DRAFT_184740 [Aspergillus oleicola]
MLADTGDGIHDGGSEEREGLLRGFDYDIDPANPPWGVVEHPGWSAPESSLSPASNAEGDNTQGQQPPMQGLCYRAVIRELPHLIEAKAVSLAPPDPISTLRQDDQVHLDNDGVGNEGEETEPLRIPDTRIVAILRRLPTMSLRSYIAHLSTLSILNPPETGLEFLSLYERARFSGRELYESEFRELMGVFADLLRGMRFEIDQQRLIEMGMDMDVPQSNDEASLFGSRSESVIGPSDEEGETTEGESETDRGSLGSDPASRHRYGYQFQKPYQYQYQHQQPYPFASSSPGARMANPNSNSHFDGAGAGAGGDADAASTSSSIRRPQHPPQLNPYNYLRYPTLGAHTPSTHSLRPFRTNTSGASSSGSASASASASVSRPHVHVPAQRSRPVPGTPGTPRSQGSGTDSASTSGSASGSGTGSVIRLADARTESVTGLPYVLGNH